MSATAKGSATQKRDLRTGHSLWQDSAFTGVPSKGLSHSLSVDVVVIGAGITGAFMAHTLTRAAKDLKKVLGHDPRILVLDRRPPLTGSTVASTAMLQWEVDLPMTDLAKSVGEDHARRVYQRTFRALGDLAELIKAENIRCAFETRATLYLAGDEYGHRALSSEAKARQAAGLPSEYLTGAQVRERFGIDRTGAILSQHSASADPGQLAAALMRRAEEAGAQVLSPVEVVDVLSDPDGVSLKTDSGHAIRARKVVFCSGYELPDMVSIPKADILSTWALASKPKTAMPAWLTSMMVWEASDPYLYFRSTPDGRVILGGEDEEAEARHSRPALLKKKAETLRRKLKAMLPEIELEPDYVWAGAFGNSTTGLPFIAPVQNMDHVWAVAGLGGNGITYSVIASQIVTAALCGKPDPDTELFTAR